MGGELTNVKYRDGRKNFKLYKGAEKVFYNIDSIVGYEYCIIVEGEMDVLALHEAGITNAISVPNGATLNSNNLDYLDSCIDYFEDKEKIILAVDSDEAGQALQTELIRRLGSEVCFLSTFEDCKDANEYLQKYGKEKLTERITGARPVPLENVTTFRDIEDEVTDFVRNGFKKGFQVGLRILMIYFQLILVNLLLSLVYLLPVKVISSIKWLSAIMRTMVGKQLSLRQKMYRRIYTLIS